MLQNQNRRQQEETMYEEPLLAPEVIEELNEAFNLLNTGNKEFLDHRELKAAMRAFGLEIDHTDIKDIYESFGKNLETEGFYFDEFKSIMSERLEDRNSKKEIKRLFDLLDVDKTGYINLDNMKKIAQDIQERISDEDLAEIIEEADKDKDGVLKFQDFYNVMSIRDTLYYD